MCKENFDKISRIRTMLNDMEDALKSLRDYAGSETKETINRALTRFSPLRDGLWCIDRSLETERDNLCQR